MVGSGASDRSKEAFGMMALHEALRSVCLNSDWTYSVFWTIRPRLRARGGNGCKVGDDNGSLMLMWEDGFCRGRVSECLEEMNGDDDPVTRAFRKMSIQLYNYGEGLMGKVASDKCHKWVFKEPKECEPNISNYWQSSFDSIPPEWSDQFESGIQTIAVIQAGHGLLQLGSCKIIPEDMHFVLRMRRTFESLGYQSGFYVSQLFSSNKTTSSPSTPTQSATPIQSPPNLSNWGPRPFSPANPPPQSSARLGVSQSKDETHMFLDPTGDHGGDIKWPNGLTFLNALTTGNGRLLFNPESYGSKPDQNCQSANFDVTSVYNSDSANSREYVSVDTHSETAREMDNRFKRSFTLPARMASSSSSSSSTLLDHQQQQLLEAGMYMDVMGSFLQ